MLPLLVAFAAMSLDFSLVGDGNLPTGQKWVVCRSSNQAMWGKTQVRALTEIARARAMGRCLSAPWAWVGFFGAEFSPSKIYEESRTPEKPQHGHAHYTWGQCHQLVLLATILKQGY